MTAPQTVDLTLIEAADLIDSELALASRSLETELDIALDLYVRALGLALQVGPAPTHRALAAILDGARRLSSQRDSDGLSALGPALIDLVGQVRVAGALPATTAMEAWATVATDLGVLIGQVGLALALTKGHRQGILNRANALAVLLDEATGARFDLTAWVDGLHFIP
jgi:hypothetical protein